MMKAYIVSDQQDDKTLSTLEGVVDSLKSRGVKVDDSQLRNSDNNDGLDEIFKKNMKGIKNCDFLVADVTNLFSGTGYLISTALNQKKPVLALFDKTSKSTPSTMIRGSQSNKLVYYFEYDKESTDEIINKFLKKIKSIMDTKFILIISAQIDRYLEWASSSKRMHKAQIVRNAIEDAMSKDKEWKEYIESI